MKKLIFNRKIVVLCFWIFFWNFFGRFSFYGFFLFFCDCSVKFKDFWDFLLGTHFRKIVFFKNFHFWKLKYILKIHFFRKHFRKLFRKQFRKYVFLILVFLWNIIFFVRNCFLEFSENPFEFLTFFCIYDFFYSFGTFLNFCDFQGNFCRISKMFTEKIHAKKYAANYLKPIKQLRLFNIPR